ncbi:MAG: gluconate kinase [Bacteroidetes bacterium QH_1_61_8]|nr:MAG: gluconate kinase [Bacteroidetes bacterium QH_1_61_8]
MERGEPLTDADRGPWLRALRDFIADRLAAGEPAVVTCSALKASYRNTLLEGLDDADLVYLRGSYELVRRRLEARTDHFFDAELLESQFETLEEPGPDEALIVDIDAPPDALVRTIQRKLTGLPDPSQEGA